MKRPFKIILFVFLISITLAFAVVAVAFFIYPTPKLSHQKLCKQSAEICFFDCFNNSVLNYTPKNYGGNVQLANLNPHTLNAFIAVEDKRFFKHDGIDLKGVLRAIKNDLFAKSLKQGGSTISQQLIKNTHLSPKKTLGRKIQEIKLTLQLERNYSKQDILQFYLNGIYFGEGCYGLQNASLYYFDKTADKLTISESACLAGCVKAPSVYNPLKKECLARRNIVLKLMYEQGFICKNEYDNAIREGINLKHDQRYSNYFSIALDEVISRADVTPYFSGKMNIYTNFDKRAQDLLNDNLSDIKTDKKAVVCSKQGKVFALLLPKGDFLRMPASTIKPLLCYAPALENGKVALATKILDEKCDFNGYSPSNYGNKYNGWVSVETALSQSLNVPAVKILQLTGVKNAKKYLEQMGITINENSLNVALGAYSDGVKLLDLCTAYTTFLNGGNCFDAHLVNSVEINGKKIYDYKQNPKKIFRAGTCDLINQALKACAKTGTAKSLCELPFEVCAKTGTNGNSSGNTDAYTICYTSEHLFAVWLGNADNSPMQNYVTGGYTAGIANRLLADFYALNYPINFNLSNDVTTVKLCKFAYEQGKILLKDKNAPERFCFDSLFLKGFEPTAFSEEYSCPALLNCTISVAENGVIIRIEKNAHVQYEILREMQNGNSAVFYGNNELFVDENLKNGNYTYCVTPFVNSLNGQKIYGKKIILPQVKIQNDSSYHDFDWWDE